MFYYSIEANLRASLTQILWPQIIYLYYLFYILTLTPTLIPENNTYLFFLFRHFRKSNKL